MNLARSNLRHSKCAAQPERTRLYCWWCGWPLWWLKTNERGTVITETPTIIACSEDDPIAWLTYVGSADDAEQVWRSYIGENDGTMTVEHVGVRDWEPDEDCDEDAPHDDPEVCACSSYLADGYQMQTSVDDPRATQAWRVEWDG